MQWTRFLCMLLISLVRCRLTEGMGLLLLYRPKDITNECAQSHEIRYDISYGMGMSDTITLVFRTLNEVDYECYVEITSQRMAYLIVVIRYPGDAVTNCKMNPHSFTLIRKKVCTYICDAVMSSPSSLHSKYFVETMKGKFRFRFASNSSVNVNMNANMYQLTVTSARQVKNPTDCVRNRNESLCNVGGKDYCYTSGVFCDGIKNCGVDDWYDERKSDCGLPVEKLSTASVITVIALVFLVVIAGAHLIDGLLPTAARSFFIFNANEDNRLRVDPVLVPETNADEKERNVVSNSRPMHTGVLNVNSESSTDDTYSLDFDTSS